MEIFYVIRIIKIIVLGIIIFLSVEKKKDYNCQGSYIYNVYLWNR